MQLIRALAFGIYGTSLALNYRGARNEVRIFFLLSVHGMQKGLNDTGLQIEVRLTLSTLDRASNG